MNQGKKNKKKSAIRLISGLVLGAGLGFAASSLASSAGSSCMILCNQEVAVPYFAAMGILVAWR
jgi:hypothetical protein